MQRVLGNISCYLDPKVKVKGQIMYFLVNASSKLFDVATSNFEAAQVTLGSISCDLDHHVKVKMSNTVFSCTVHASTSPPLEIAALNFVGA